MGFFKFYAVQRLLPMDTIMPLSTKILNQITGQPINQPRIYRVAQHQIDHSFLMFSLFAAQDIPVLVRLSSLYHFRRYLNVTPGNKFVHRKGTLVVNLDVNLRHTRRQVTNNRKISLSRCTYTPKKRMFKFYALPFDNFVPMRVFSTIRISLRFIDRVAHSQSHVRIHSRHSIIFH